MATDDVDRLRAMATHLRAMADRVRRAIDEVAAYDRPDVWSGRRANELRVRLTRHRLLAHLAAVRIDAAAARIDSEARRRSAHSALHEH